MRVAPPLLVLVLLGTPAAALTCPAAPRDDCRVAAASRLELRRDAADPSRNQLKWRGTRGRATLRPGFGDPVAGSDTALCLYDASGLVAQIDIAGGGTCAGAPCWRASSSGFRFADATAASGVEKLLLRANAGDRAKALLLGRGAALPVPPLPLQAPVVAQLANDATGVCLTTRFAAAELAANDGGRLSGVSGVILPAPTTPRPSAACGAAVTGYAGGANARSLAHGGRTRTFGVYVPVGYDFAGATPAPVVMILHGGFGSGGQAFATARLAALADARGVVVVYPDGVASPGGVRTWNAGGCCGYALTAGIDDIGFIDALLDQLETDLCIDRRRIHATGMSNGAQLSHRLACDRSWRIASVAPVAGTDNTLACAPTRPMPVMHIHGTADQNAPFAGGMGCGLSGIDTTSAPDTIAAWQGRNGCPGSAKPRLVAGDGVCETHGRCRNEAEVVLCTIAAGGHTWPGGLPTAIPGIGDCLFGAQSQSFDASARALDFFALHPLP